ncbi:F0F1 ATP synthase subunit B [Oceanobacter kriegii]|uniref:F0F1 ATP synthase subunit B n=1 Tax=Oceanobacter kriegii TaxID=64972 RepID=UPI0004855511|nr:F0F1 ATP synthase subunit B [Oceanobacter kriegii]
MNMNLTILGQLIAFAIFVWFCMKYVWPPITSAMQEREKKIADGLDAANRAERDLELAQEKAASQLRESKEKAAEIIEQANKRANQIVDEAKDTARAEGDRIVAAAQAEVEQEVNRAKEALRKQVSELAVVGAAKILGKSVDASAHADVLNQLTEEL